MYKYFVLYINSVPKWYIKKKKLSCICTHAYLSIVIVSYISFDLI